MTYRELLIALAHLSDHQLGCDVTIELRLALTDECYPAALEICDTDHDILDENHPVIYAKRGEQL